MANVKIKLDKRTMRADKTYPLTITLHHRSTIRIATGMSALPEEWNAAAGVYIGSSPTVRANNARLLHMRSMADTLLLNLSINGELHRMTSGELRARIEKELNIRQEQGRGATVIDYLEKAKNGKSPRTRQLFYYTQKKVRELLGNRRMADVDSRWVAEFRDRLLESYSANTTRQDMTRLGRAITLAMEDGLITHNPLRGVRKPRSQVRKKALSIETLRKLRDAVISHRGGCLARDIFMLQFYLMGINIADLYDATTLRDGRLEYKRRKTGTLYSIKIEPEAAAIINRLNGGERLVAIPYKSPTSAVSSITGALKRLGVNCGLSTNWARHTWATIAAELEIPIETISHALGHQIGSPITAIYVAYNQKKVDEANRRVIDYLNADLKGK